MEMVYLDDLEDQLQQELLVLPYMLNLPRIFESCTLNQQHAILNEVFKQGLTFEKGVFRTPWINPEFEHNSLILKQKDLLKIEQVSEKTVSVPSGGAPEDVMQHLQELFRIIREIYKNKKRMEDNGNI